ncbi:MAG: hypothetical protein GF316_09985 [Candidatus Lokiarchaeota archaeon]|nr:hypothetical protein [Candidatus Lokiarchaeota archaeon]
MTKKRDLLRTSSKLCLLIWILINIYGLLELISMIGEMSLFYIINVFVINPAMIIGYILIITWIFDLIMLKKKSKNHIILYSPVKNIKIIVNQIFFSIFVAVFTIIVIYYKINHKIAIYEIIIEIFSLSSMVTVISSMLFLLFYPIALIFLKLFKN